MVCYCCLFSSVSRVLAVSVGWYWLLCFIVRPLFVKIFRCLDTADLLSFSFLAISIGFSGRSESICFCRSVRMDLGTGIVGSLSLLPVVSNVRYIDGIPIIPAAM